MKKLFYEHYKCNNNKNKNKFSWRSKTITEKTISDSKQWMWEKKWCVYTQWCECTVHSVHFAVFVEDIDKDNGIGSS